MTTTTANAALADTRPSLMSRLGAYFVAYADARSRRDQVAALSALSDEELAARGLTRDRIVAHVFADRLYL